MEISVARRNKSKHLFQPSWAHTPSLSILGSQFSLPEKHLVNCPTSGASAPLRLKWSLGICMSRALGAALGTRPTSFEKFWGAQGILMPRSYPWDGNDVPLGPYFDTGPFKSFLDGLNVSPYVLERILSTTELRDGAVRRTVQGWSTPSLPSAFHHGIARKDVSS